MDPSFDKNMDLTPLPKKKKKWVSPEYIMRKFISKCWVGSELTNKPDPIQLNTDSDPKTGSVSDLNTRIRNTGFLFTHNPIRIPTGFHNCGWISYHRGLFIGSRGVYFPVNHTPPTLNSESH